MRQVCFAICTALVCGSVRAGEEQDRFEEQAVNRHARHKAEHRIQVERWERANVLRDLEAAYPGKVPKTDMNKPDEEAEAWFTLVAGTRDEWRKADAVAAGLGPMYQRWLGRLELGPVPSIKREEFIKFAKQIIQNTAAALAQADKHNPDGEADKVFRILDANSDGELTSKEMTSGMLEDKALGGRVTKEQYREYFRRRVDKQADTMFAAMKANDAAVRKLTQDNPEKRTGLPAWFTTLDKDKTGQVSLYEWRKSGRSLAEFQEMDLNGDGLITPDEYLRWMRKKQADEAQKKREPEKQPDEPKKKRDPEKP
jgi:Ca2+-binding EF-hand superfamily protein